MMNVEYIKFWLKNRKAYNAYYEKKYSLIKPRCQLTYKNYFAFLGKGVKTKIDYEKWTDIKVLMAKMAEEFHDNGCISDDLLSDYHRVLFENIIDDAPSNRIMFWHIPKSGGTNYITLMNNKYYINPIKNYLPPIEYPSFFNYLIKNSLEYLPFISSAHIIPDIEIIRSYNNHVTIKRNEHDRRYSLFKQLALSKINKKMYNSIYRYGRDFDVRHVTPWSFLNIVEKHKLNSDSYLKEDIEIEEIPLEVIARVTDKNKTPKLPAFVDFILKWAINGKNSINNISD